MRRGEFQHTVRLKYNDYSPSRPRNLEGWPVVEQNGLSAGTPDAWFGDNIHA